LRDIDKIRERHDVVESFVKNDEIRGAMNKGHMTSMLDVFMLNNKLSRKRAGLQDIFKLYQVGLRLPDIKELLKSMDSRAVEATIYDRISANSRNS
jgi:DNA mismatch repair ATPase MutS